MVSTSLSTRQRRYLAEWQAKWSALSGVATPIERSWAELALTCAYRAAGETPPRFVWVDSPRQALLALGLVAELGEHAPFRGLGGVSADMFRTEFSDALWRSPRAGDDDFLHEILAAIASPVRREVQERLRNPIAGYSQRLWNESVSTLRQQDAWGRSWQSVCTALGGPPAERLLVQLAERGHWSGLADANRPGTPDDSGRRYWQQRVVSRLNREIDAIKRDLWGWDEPWSDALWLGRATHADLAPEYTFYRDALGIPISSHSSWRLVVWTTIAKFCGWIWPRKHICVVSQRPMAIHTDESGALHHASAAALEFADRLSLYSWHGTEVPREWLTAPGSLRTTDALFLGDDARRRAAAGILGWAEILTVLSPRTIDRDDPAIGELLEVELPDPHAPGRYSAPARFLRVRCGTGRDFVLSVPIHVRTAREANAWTYGLEAHEYELEART